MKTLNKILQQMVIFSLLLFPLGTVFAGGSSMSVEVKGSHVTALPGEVIASGLSLDLKTYFPSGSGINNVRIQNLSIACHGGNLFEKVDMVMETPQSDPLFLNVGFVKKNNLIIGQIGGIDLHNNSSYQMKFNFKVKETVATPMIVHCGIENLTLVNLDNNETFYSGMTTGGRVYVAKNESFIVFYTGNPETI